MGRRASKSAGVGSGSSGAWWSESGSAMWPSVLLVVLTAYSFVYVLDLLDVTVDDGTTLLLRFKDIRKGNLENARLEAARVAEVAQARLEQSALSGYSGDPVWPWENPFTSLGGGAVKKASGSSSAASSKQSGKGKAVVDADAVELAEELEQSVFAYLRLHKASVSSPSGEVARLLDEFAPTRDKLAKRQLFVEERLREVLEIDASAEPVDYTYRSVFSVPEVAAALTLPPTLPPADFEVKDTQSLLGSLFGSLGFGSSSSGPAQAQQQTQQTQQQQQHQQHQHHHAWRGSEAFAALSERPGKDGVVPTKSASAILLEQALSETGYSRHRAKAGSSALPMWIVSYGRRCPAAAAVAAKDAKEGTGKMRVHAMLCAAGGAEPQRRGLLAHELNPDDDDELLVLAFRRLYDAGDRAELSELERADGASSASAFVVMQRNGAGKPQLVRSVMALAASEKYHAPQLALVAAPVSLTPPPLWQGKYAWAVRAWAVLLSRGGRGVAAVGADGDVVRATVPLDAPLAQGKRESAEETTVMRFPSLALTDSALAPRVELLPAHELQHALGLSADAYHATVQLPLRRAVARAAQRLLQPHSHSSHQQQQNQEPDETQVIATVEHVCLDVLFQGHDMHAQVLTVASDCAVQLASEQVRRALTVGAVHAAERLLAGTPMDEAELAKDGLFLIADTHGVLYS